MKKIFIAPRSGKKSRENFLKTIEYGYDFQKVKQFLKKEDIDQLENSKKLYIWGNVPSNKNFWENMAIGDFVFFYQEKKLTWCGQVLYKTHNKNLADNLWEAADGKSFEYVFFLKNLTRINVELDYIIKISDYKPKFIVQGFMKLKESAIEKIIQEFGNIENFIQKYQVSSKTLNEINEIEKKYPMKKDNIVDAFKIYLQNRNLIFNERIVKRFISSLVTKPFVILTGNSGTGKTQIAIKLAEWFDPEKTNDNLYKGKILEGNSGFIWGVEYYHIRFTNISFSKSLVKDFFNVLEYSEPEDALIITDDGKEFNCRLSYYNRAVTIYAYKDFKNWLENVGIGNLFTVEPQPIDENSKYKNILKVSKIKGELHSASRYAVVPVGADWTDNRNILGFYNHLSDNFQSTPTLDLIIDAISDPERPYFLILDEMNLSHVERYFSDFLSAFESGEEIPLHKNGSQVQSCNGRNIRETIQIPPNLFVIGTVNIDETTYMFSPKVLDRANVIEMKVRAEQLESYNYQVTENNIPKADKDLIRQFYSTSCKARSVKGYGTIKELSKTDSIKDDIIKAFNILNEFDLEFGFRTIKEAVQYAMVVQEIFKYNKEEIFDEQLIQKILPKLNGSRNKLEKVLIALIKLCDGLSIEKINDIIKNDETIRAYDSNNSEKADEKSLSKVKLLKMLRNLRRDQFVSFI